MTMQTKTTTKTCNKCGETKPLTDFHRSKQTPSGRTAWCKTCKRHYHADRMTRQGKTVKTPHTTEWPPHPYMCVYQNCENYRDPESPIGHCHIHKHLINIKPNRKQKRCPQCQKPTLSTMCKACQNMTSSLNLNKKTYK